MNDRTPPERTFIASFTYRGADHSVDILACTWEEAEDKLAALRAGGTITAELIERIECDALNPFPFHLWLQRKGCSP